MGRKGFLFFLLVCASSGCSIVSNESFTRLTPVGGLAVSYSSTTLSASGNWTGSFYPITFTITNNASVTAVGLSVSAPSGMPFTGGGFPGQGGTCASSLAAGASCTIVVQAKNRAAANAGGTLQMGYSLLNEAKTLPIVIEKAGPNPISPLFNPAKGFNSFVAVAVLANDGSHKLYAAGYFTAYNNETVPNLIRMNVDGTIDTTFQVGSSFDQIPNCLVPANDGSGNLYVCGWFSTYNGTSISGVARLLPNGSLDTTFNSGAVSVNAIAVTNDGSGKIYIAGGFEYYNGVQVNGLARLKTDGSLDATFNVGSGASAGFDSSYYYECYTVAVAADGSGKVYVGGHFFSYSGQSPYAYLYRINTDGTLDTTFNSGGAGPDARFPVNINAILPLPSGQVYIGGIMDTYNGTASPGIARLNSNGTLDGTFAVGTGMGAGSTYGANHIALAQDGTNDLIVTGDFYTYQGNSANGLVRIHSNGSYDSATTLSFESYTGGVNAVPLDDGTGRIYLAGYFLSYQTNSVSYLVRVSSSGVLDSSFTSSTAGFDGGVSVLVPANDNSGKLYVLGDFYVFDGTAVRSLVRLNYDGTLDTSFSAGTGVGGGGASAIALTTDGSGQFYLGGSFTTYNGTAAKYLVRLNQDGSLDSGFNAGASFSGGTLGTSVYALALANDGSNKLYVGGNFTKYQGTAVPALVRLNTDGSLDTTFNAPSQISSEPGQIQPLNDGTGRIYVSGEWYFAPNYIGLVRLNSDGSLDASFDSTNTLENLNQQTFAIAQDGSGKVYDTGNGLVRLNSDGSIDSSFVIGSGVTGDIESILAPNDGTGQVYLAGAISAYNGTAVSGMIRLNPDGSLDPSFSTGSGFSSGANSIGLSALAVVLDVSNRIYVGGNFGSYQSTIISNFARLECDGRLDN